MESDAQRWGKGLKGKVSANGTMVEKHQKLLKIACAQQNPGKAQPLPSAPVVSLSRGSGIFGPVPTVVPPFDSDSLASDVCACACACTSVFDIT